MGVGSSLRQQAREHFAEARREAFVRGLMAVLSGQPRELLSFQEVQQRLDIRSCTGGRLQVVELDKIVGSEGRYADFDRDFLPLHGHSADRWTRLDMAFHRLEDLPPVELYQIGDAYFVRDGNHRISVARTHGAQYIDAYVFDCPSRVKLGPDVDVARLLAEEEHLHFLEKTRFDEILGVDIKLTAPGAYAALRRHLEGHREYLSDKFSKEVTFEEAAKSWCENVYLPIVKVVRDTGILERFPGRTEGDLYVWVFEHRYYLEERYGKRVSIEEAAQSLARHRGARGYRLATTKLLQGLLKTVGTVVSWIRA